MDITRNDVEMEALDGIDFARGSPNSTWGSIRAAIRHPEPFDLKYVTIGNEDCGKPYYRDYSDRNPCPSSENSSAQASGPRGAVKKVTNNSASLLPNIRPTKDDVALSDDITPLDRTRSWYSTMGFIHVTSDSVTTFTAAASVLQHGMTSTRTFLVRCANEEDASLLSASTRLFLERGTCVIEKSSKFSCRRRTLAKYRFIDSSHASYDPFTWMYEQEQFLVDTRSRVSIPRTQAAPAVSPILDRTNTRRNVNTLHSSVSQDNKLGTYGGKEKCAKSYLLSEYEALIAGLELAIKMEVRHLQVFSDSLLMTNHVKGSYEACEESMKRYLAKEVHFGSCGVRGSKVHCPKSSTARAMATPIEIGNLRSECIVEEIAPSCLMPGRLNITLRDHLLFPVNLILPSSENAILVPGDDASGWCRSGDHCVLIINISFVSLGATIFCF
nr:alpha-L-arabinofuranosidase 1-like [Tanacetum cinerariifolium]